MRWNITSMGGALVLGSIKLTGRKLVLSVNSAARAQQGQAVLQEALGSLAKPFLTEIRTLDQVMAKREPDAGDTEADLPPELQRQLVHELLDRRYRTVLDESVPALGGVSPRQAATTSKGAPRLPLGLRR